MKARYLLPILAIAIPGTLSAAALVVTKSVSVVADQVNTLNPKALPGSTIDVALTVDNPNTLLSNNIVGQVKIVDTIPSYLQLQVTDYATAGAGPIEFNDGSLLGTGLISSGLSLNYKGLRDATDGVEFSTDGINWTYQPTSTGGYDANVRAIRVTLTGLQAPLSRFRLRYRTMLR
ncbi:hypothetical protein GGQ80_000453 [Sphingomonas jinjuensis]|uniref:Uncharacterized protein n=1 Tax=Sphingomonas jinjuensis TaxID=535907 RepID=A0A840FAP6_9SPHN|nr:hypothetical protein [Sphingomonas jinjuensis]MBB4152577.1 hypothetical protein [Sphingomonas jinjuensis]